MSKLETRIRPSVGNSRLDRDTREGEPPQTEEVVVPRRCTLDGFAEEVAVAGGLDLTGLHPLTELRVETENNVYRIFLLEPPDPRVVVHGGRFFPLPTEASLSGSSFGGNFLKMGWIGYGMRMEIYQDGRRIVTSPVRRIDVSEEIAQPAPF
jgi:hypothetical protein